MPPKISVIIRTYDRAGLIERAINSVLRQSFQDFEIIVADDGSTDNTKSIVEQISEKDARLKYFTQGHSGRPGKTLNLGLAHSRGRYIAMLDSDDEWLPLKLEKQIQLLESSPARIGLIVSRVVAINPDGSREERIIGQTENFLESILLKGYLFPSSILARKETFDAIGPIDENCLIADDWDMFIRLAEKYDYDFVDEALCQYYIHHTNISFTKNYLRHATDLEYLLNKHSVLFQQYPKVLEYQYINLASYLVAAGQMNKARNYLKKSFRLNRSIKNLLRLSLSYFGSAVYRKYRNERGKTV